MNKRIVLETDKIKRPYTGLGQFCLHLCQALLTVRNNHNEYLDTELLLYYPAKADPHLLPQLPKKNISLLGKYCRQANPKADLWHMMHQDSPYFPPKKTPMLLTVHDLNFLYSKSPAKIKQRIKTLQKKIDRAAHVVTISEFSRTCLEQHCRVNKPISVIYNGADILPLGQAVQPSNVARDQHFLLAIGTVIPRKNFHTLVAMMVELPQFELIIAGNADPDYLKLIYTLAEQHQVSDRIKCIGAVNEREKAWLYHHCQGLLFPSLAEGFGLPVIEAMRAGKPVFLSKLTSLPEIGGKEAFYFDHFEPEHMQQVVRDGLQQMQQDPAKAQRLQAVATRFSWEKAAKAYWDIYSSLC